MLVAISITAPKLFYSRLRKSNLSNLNNLVTSTGNGLYITFYQYNKRTQDHHNKANSTGPITVQEI